MRLRHAITVHSPIIAVTSSYAFVALIASPQLSPVLQTPIHATLSPLPEMWQLAGHFPLIDFVDQ